MNYLSSFIDLKSFLVSILGDFSGFWGSVGLPGAPVGALGLPCGPKVTPKRLPRGSGGRFGPDLGLPGGALEIHFSQKVVIFSDSLLGKLPGPLFK